MRPVTEAHDYAVKLKQAQSFLQKGAKVKVAMAFSGRELRFKDQGKELMLVRSAGGRAVRVAGRVAVRAAGCCGLSCGRGPACGLTRTHSSAPAQPSDAQRFVEDLTAVGKVDGAINFKTSTFSVTMAPIK